MPIFVFYNFAKCKMAIYIKYITSVHGIAKCMYVYIFSMKYITASYNFKFIHFK